MRNSIFALVLFTLFIGFVACDDEDNCTCTSEIYGEWEVKQFLSVESRGYAKDDNYKPFIEFKRDGTVDIRLDANGCFGNFELMGEADIDIENAGCTEMCCDSDFSMKFVEMLPQVDSYSIDDNKMKLNVSGWGWIELEYVSD